MHKKHLFELQIALSILLSLLLLLATLWFTPLKPKRTTVGVECIMNTDFQYVQRVSSNLAIPLFRGVWTELDDDTLSISLVHTEQGRFLILEGRFLPVYNKTLSASIAILTTEDICIRLNGLEPSRVTREADFPAAEKHYAFSIVNEEEGYLIRTSLPVIDATDSVQDGWTDPYMEYFPRAFVTLFVILELAFLLSVTLLLRRRRYHPALLSRLEQIKQTYAPDQVRAGRTAYARYLQTCLGVRLVLWLVGMGFLPLYLSSRYFISEIFCRSYLLLVSSAGVLLLWNRYRLFRQSPHRLVCCLAQIGDPPFQRYLLGLNGIGRFPELLALAQALLLDGQPEQSRYVLNIAWNTMPYKWPGQRLRAHFLRFLLLLLTSPDRLTSELPWLLRACRRAPLTRFWVLRNSRLSGKQFRQALQCCCEARWPELLQLTQGLTRAKAIPAQSVGLWILRYQAAVLGRQWDIAETTLNALAPFPGLVSLLKIPLDSSHLPGATPE